MTAINTNVGALMSRANAKSADGRMQTHMRRLSSGLRVNSASDDAAGLAVANKLKSQLTGINMGIRNSSDAIGVLQTADAGYATAMNITLRMKELAIQMSNSIYTTADRTNAAVEFAQLGAQVEAISDNTLFNGEVLLSGAYGSSTNLMSMRIGDATAEVLSLDLDDADIYSTTHLISSTTQASDTATALAAAINTLSNAQADVGAYINRLQFNIDNLSAAATVTEAAVGRVMDADYARETGELAKQQILNQAATSMLAQANQSKQSILALLQ